MMPDDFAPPPRRVVPCVPRYRDNTASEDARPIEKQVDVTGSVPVADGPREADEQPVIYETFAALYQAAKEPVVVTRFLDGTLEPVSASDSMVLIWSGEHQAWWRPGGRGYTAVRDDAGRWPFREAARIVANFGPEKKIRLQLDPLDELEQARQARDLLNRLVEQHKITMRLIGHDQPDGPDMLELRRLVPRMEYDEEVMA